VSPVFPPLTAMPVSSAVIRETFDGVLLSVAGDSQVARTVG